MEWKSWDFLAWIHVEREGGELGALDSGSGSLLGKKTPLDLVPSLRWENGNDDPLVLRIGNEQRYPAGNQLGAAPCSPEWKHS